MKKNLSLTQIFASIDKDFKEMWKVFTEDEKKDINFWLLNRYISSVNGSRRSLEQAIIRSNEFYNKHFTTIGASKDRGNPELLWQLLCVAGKNSNTTFRPYIGFKKQTSNIKAINLLEQIYPNMKQDEVELLARLSTKKELRELAKEHNIDINL